MSEAMYYILLALLHPVHGYGVMQRVRELSGGRLVLGPGTLYGILTRMHTEGYIPPGECGGPAQGLRHHRGGDTGAAGGIPAAQDHGAGWKHTGGGTQMKRRYALHPWNLPSGKPNQFYSEMAAKGWFLEKRGAWFSRFRRGEPAAMRYGWSWRICAFWTRITACRRSRSASMRNAAGSMSPDMGFSTSFPPRPDSDAPEFYTDPRQQALVLRGLRRSYVSSWILLIVIFAVNTLFYFSFGSRTFGNWWGSWYHVFVSDTGIVLTLAAMLVLGIVLTALRKHPHRTAVPPPAQGHTHGPHPQKEKLVL